MESSEFTGPRNDAPEFSRRGFVTTAVTASGGFALALAVPSAAAAFPASALPLQESAPGTEEINPWVVIEPDDTVVIRVPQAEIGVGVTTTLPMLVAEELHCDWAKVKPEFASPNRNVRENEVYGLINTSGSRGVMSTWQQLQQAGASARVRLLTAAAQSWNVPVSECEAANSTVTHKPSGRSVTFGKLAGQAAKIKLDKEPDIKTQDQFTLVGKPLPRLDTPVKVDGTAKFGIDTQLPGMVYAAVAFPPVPGGKTVSVDDSAIKGKRGIVKLVQLPELVAVIADNYWRAKTALGQLKITWDGGDSAKVNSADISRMYHDMLDGEHAVARNDGDAASVLAKGKVIEATYEVPYLSHAPMEPQNATVLLTKDRLDIWMGSQAPVSALRLAAGMVKMKPEQVYVHNCYVGGGFGRRTRNDDTRSAVAIAMAANLEKPIKMVWSREEDTRHDRYRPAAVTRFRAVLGKDGMPEALEAKIGASSIMQAFGQNPLPNGIDWTAVEIIQTSPYRIPNFYVGQAVKNTHIPVAFWRSVGGSQNTFFIDGFIDELAHAAGKDPLAYRRALVNRKDIHLVLDTLEEKSNWGSKLPKGRARGIALCERKLLVDASVAEITVSPEGRIHVDRVVTVIDFSRTVNPSIVEAQVQGGIHWALSAMYYGEITVKDGAVEQGNFDTYNIVRLDEAPEVEVYEVRSGRNEWGGIGELGATTVVPAVANAIFAATGKRIRKLPLKNIDPSEFRPI